MACWYEVNIAPHFLMHGIFLVPSGSGSISTGVTTCLPPSCALSVCWHSAWKLLNSPGCKPFFLRCTHGKPFSLYGQYHRRFSANGLNASVSTDTGVLPLPAVDWMGANGAGDGSSLADLTAFTSPSGECGRFLKKALMLDWERAAFLLCAAVPFVLGAFGIFRMR